MYYRFTLSVCGHEGRSFDYRRDPHRLRYVDISMYTPDIMKLLYPFNPIVRFLLIDIQELNYVH